MPDSDIENLIKSEFEVFSKSYPGFILIKNEDGSYTLKGNLTFEADYEDETIADTFGIEILIPNGYPDLEPTLFETGGRLPDDYHMYKEGFRCLGAPLAVKKKFFQNKTILGFVNDNVVPYLYSFCYKQKHGEMPYGELSHLALGIIEYYQEEFHIDDTMSILGLLRILAENDYRGHLPCPCGSNIKLRQCHGDKLRELNKYQTPEGFLLDYIRIAMSIPLAKRSKVPYEFLIKQYQKQMREAIHGA